jgi:hypothetical protein
MDDEALDQKMVDLVLIVLRHQPLAQLQPILMDKCLIMALGDQALWISLRQLGGGRDLIEFWGRELDIAPLFRNKGRWGLPVLLSEARPACSIE